VCVNRAVDITKRVRPKKQFLSVFATPPAPSSTPVDGRSREIGQSGGLGPWGNWGNTSLRLPLSVTVPADRYQWDSHPSHAYWNDRGEILRSMWDARERRRSAGPHPPIKNESVGIEDDQIPS
jgi:hypothetical protein